MKQNMNGNHRHTTGSIRQNINSNIPLRKQLSRQSSDSTASRSLVTDTTHRWKQKYEEGEEKRKLLLSEKEKALRSLQELERKHLSLQEKHEHLETELFEKNEEFTKLSTASKNLYKEYETLKNQYETETDAMARALKDASQWYKENKALKRKTLLLSDQNTEQEVVDAGSDYGSDSDIENLNKTIKQLSTEVADLQTELDSCKQSEFQAQEQTIRLSEEVELYKNQNQSLKNEIEQLKTEHQQLLRVSDVMRKELEKLKELEETQRDSIDTLRKDAENYRKERNILAHQSTLLLQGLNGEDGDDSLMFLQEIESLKRSLEEERNKYEEEINHLQTRLEEQESNSHIEILEERLKLVESELEKAKARAEAAEEKLKAPPPPPPLPAPPPPPPLPPPNAVPDRPPLVPLRRRRSRVTAQELAESIGVQESSPEKKPAAPGVNEDIINAIKEGKFTLKKAKKERNQDKETPKAVSEILNILGSLRRTKSKKSQAVTTEV